MDLTEVTSKETRKAFYDTARNLYRGDPAWVCPLDAEIEGIFNPSSNILFRDGNAIRWILRDDSGKLIGRVAAFYNRGKAAKNEQLTGGMGFFECIHDQSSANLLFEACKSWLQKQGMEAMDGPITFGENITYWGLLVDGYTLPAYGMPYNHPYYKELFEAYGFKPYYDQYSYEKNLAEPFPERQVKYARFMQEKYQFEHFTFAGQKKYLTDLCDIYNRVWEDFHEDYTPLDYAEMEKVMKKARPIINEELIWFGYDQGKPVAVVVVFPDVNQILKKLGNGRLNFWNMLRFLYYKKTGTITRARQLLTAVIPEYQRSGVIFGLFLTLVEALKRNRIKILDMSWVGDYNTTVKKIYQLLDLPVVKTHVTYRYLFDPTKSPQRFTNVETEKAKRLDGARDEGLRTREM